MTSLKEFLNYETGDSWNGTHYRDIEVRFDKEAEMVAVTSRNEMFSREKRTAFFTLSSLREQFDDARGARYFGNFCVAAAGEVPGLSVEEATQGAFFQFAGKAEFREGEDAKKLFSRPVNLKSAY